MTDPNVPSGPAAAEPSDWDSLFAPEPDSGVPAATTPDAKPASPPQAQPQPAQQPPSEFVIKTKTGSVYKSLDDATRGIEEKDTLIEQLRTRYALERGVDPVTGQPVNLGSQQPTSYLEDRRRYFTDLVTAAQRNDPDAYFTAQTKLISDILAPFAPVVASVAQRQAVEQVAVEIPEFPQFLNGESYRQVVDEFPELKHAIEVAKTDPTVSPRLPGLYKMAYLASQGRRLPELLKANSQQPQPQQPARPTAQPSTLPAPETGGPTLRDSIRTSQEARDRVIRDFESRGDLPLPR